MNMAWHLGDLMIRWIEFCEQVLTKANFSAKIFTEEANFYVNGEVNQ